MIKIKARIMRAARSRRLWGAVLAGGLLVPAGRFALTLVALPPGLFEGRPPQLEFLDRNGRPLRTVRPGEGPFHQVVSYAEIPQLLVQATLAAEDRRFWRHPGVDWRATLRAAGQWVLHGRVLSGGSTITQQLIKLAQPRPRTLRTKLIEALQALRLEQVWDKQRILACYLNRLEYGNFNVGCAAAAQFYFAKPMCDLSPAECALLASLPQAPSRLNPHTQFARAHKRQQWILIRMRQAGWLTGDEFNRATHEPLRLARPQRAFETPHFVDLVIQQAEASKSETRNPKAERRPKSEARNPKGLGLAIGCFGFRPSDFFRISDFGLRTSAHAVQTTLDLDLNHFAETALRHHLLGLQAQRVGNGAVVVLDNRSGDVLALVGSENYFAPAAGQVNGAWASRSAGSTFKPFTYLLALEHGATPATVVADVPTQFATSTGLFAPLNYDRRCYGPVRYRPALANSLNIAAVRVLASIGGPASLWQRLQACGITTLTRPAEDYGLGLTIGNAEARLLELANAYACLARLGEYRPFRLVAEPLADHLEARSRRVADAGAAYLIADILSDNAARVLAFGAESPLRFDFPVACKTGTSSDFRDNWAFGYTPEFTVGVWVGNFDGTPMQGVSGVTGAAPILHEVFEHLHHQYGTTWYPKPENVVECWVHPITGKRLERNGLARTSAAVKERFLASAPPLEESPDDYDLGNRVRLGSEYRQWLASGDNYLAGQAVLADELGPLRILEPLPGTTFYLDPDLPEQGRRVPLRVEGPKDLRWHSDTLKVEQENDRQIALLTTGRHQLSVWDPRTGDQAVTWIEVLAR